MAPTAFLRVDLMNYRLWLVIVGLLPTVVQAAEDTHGGAVSPFAGDFGTALWTLVIFIIVLVVLGKFAWGPILSGLQGRENFIRDSLDQAKKDREEAEARLKEYTEKIEASRSEASAIVEEGRRDAEALKVTIEDHAKAEAKAMVERAKREIGLATDSALKEIYTLSANLATGVASRIIGRELKPADHERLISESIKELRDVGGNGRSMN